MTKPDESDWENLLIVIGYLKATISDVLTLEEDDTQNLYWYIDATFVVHPDMKSHS